MGDRMTAQGAETMKARHWVLIGFGALFIMGALAPDHTTATNEGRTSGYMDCATFLDFPSSLEPNAGRRCVGDNGGTTTWGNYRESYSWKQVDA